MNWNQQSEVKVVNLELSSDAGLYSKVDFDVVGVDKKEVIPGFEPGLFGSEPKVITTTLYNLFGNFEYDRR